MISQVSVRVVDENAEHEAPEEFQAIVVSMRPLGLQQIYQFQIACTSFSIFPLCKRHCRYERQSPILRSAIKSPCEEGSVSAVRHSQRARVRHVDSCPCCKPMRDEFPCADITAVLPTGKLGKTEYTPFLSQQSFRACP